jgi:hypothetical protein
MKPYQVSAIVLVILIGLEISADIPTQKDIEEDFYV